jgi:hypothetical protein
LYTNQDALSSAKIDGVMSFLRIGGALMDQVDPSDAQNAHIVLKALRVAIYRVIFGHHVIVPHRRTP